MAHSAVSKWMPYDTKYKTQEREREHDAHFCVHRNPDPGAQRVRRDSNKPTDYAVVLALPLAALHRQADKVLLSYREGPPSYREGPTHAHTVNALSRPREHTLPALESAIAHPSLPLNEREETRRSRVDIVGCALARGVAGRVEVEAVADERDEQVLIPWMGVAQSCEHC